MSHFAEIDDNDVVIRVLVVEQDVIDSGILGDPSKWIQTSYNTRNGEHLLGKDPLRFHFAGIGYHYIRDRDIFIPPSPYASWSFNYDSMEWEPPIPRPSDTENYRWDNDNLTWVPE